MVSGLRSFFAVLVFLGFQSVQGQQCDDGMQGECNSCICCCYKIGIPRWVPNDCGCKAVVDDNLALTISLVVAAIVLSVIQGCYFTSCGRFSPYKIEPVPAVQVNLLQA